MPRTHVIAAVAVVGAVGFVTLTWGQAAAPPATAPSPARAGGYAPARIQLTQPRQNLSFYVQHPGNPEDAQLNEEINANVAKLVEETDATKKEDLEKEIKTALGKQFDSRQAARGQELKDLEERVAKLREQLNKREKAKDDIVNSRLDELKSASSGLGWGEEQGPQGPNAGLFFAPPPVPVYQPNLPGERP